jgi:4-amino-4-deoxy-L-arabinose transferase-like glycosyltransferase
MEEPPGVRRYLPIAAVVLFFAVLYGRTLGAYGMFIWDEAEYACLARSVWRGEGLVQNGRTEALRPPLLPLAGALGIAIAGTPGDRALKRVSLAFSLLVLLATGLGVLATGPERGRLAVLSACALGLFPAFWTATPRFLAEPPFAAFFVPAVLLASAGFVRDPRWFPAAWACFGLATLARYTAVLYLPAFVLVGIASASSKPNLERALASPAFWLAPLAAVAVMAPWLIRQAVAFGDPWIGFRQASGEIQAYAPALSMPAGLYFESLGTSMTWPLLALALVGAWTAARGGDRLVVACLLVAVMQIVFFSAFRYKEVRYIYGAWPFLAVCAGAGLEAVARRAPPERADLLCAGGLLVALGWASLATGPVFRLSYANGYPSFVQALELVRERTPRNGLVIAASVPQASWYLDRPVSGFPPEPRFQALLNQASWVLIVNFEPAQPPYAVALAARLHGEDLRRGAAFRFADSHFSTIAVPASVLKARLKD